MRRTLLGVVAGLLSAAAALGIAELVTVLARPEASPIIAVGQEAIDVTPRPVKEWAIRTFGERDKQVLLAGVVVSLALLAAAIGAMAVRRLPFGLAGVAAFGVVGALAAASRPNADPADVLPALVGAAAGMVVLAFLARTLSVAAARAAPAAASDGPGRRWVVLAAAGVAAGAVAAGAIGRVLQDRRFSAGRSRAGVRVPSPASPAVPIPAGADLSVAGITPFVTSNADFYRVDTALTVPQVPAEDWELRVHGLVDRPLRLTYADLLRRPLVERDITLTCVSNEVGGALAGNARWVGVRVADLLADARARPGADQVVSRSADGMTIGTPTAIVTDGRDALLAVAMNGEPVPLEHGFPVRMIVPGLYGYVSACKWLVEMELTTFEAFDPYWVRHGWASQAPIKTASRIDTPGPFARLQPGIVTVAGVAWAQRRGIDRVEVQVDDEAWQPAELAAVPSLDTWRQWSYGWDAVPGAHSLRVRAIDRAGAQQTGARMPPFPSGATGWHTIAVTVSGR